MQKISAIKCLLLIMMASFVSVCAYSQDAASILKKASEVYETSNGVRINFSLKTRSEQAQSTESVEGVINMKNDKFKFQTLDMTTWYDGKTQWTYMDRTEEVNVTESEGSELQFTNPLVFLNSYNKGFKVSLKGNSTTRQGKSAYDIEMLPKKKGDILAVLLQIEKNTGYIASIDIEAKNGLRQTIVVSNIQTNVNQPDDFFVYDSAEYPNAELIDLR